MCYCCPCLMLPDVYPYSFPGSDRFEKRKKNPDFEAKKKADPPGSGSGTPASKRYKSLSHLSPPPPSCQVSSLPIVKECTLSA